MGRMEAKEAGGVCDDNAFLHYKLLEANQKVTAESNVV